MIYRKTSQNSVFIYNAEIEALWGAMSILCGENTHNICTEIYGKEQIVEWKHKYSFLFETYSALADYFNINLLDYLLEIPSEKISLAALRDNILTRSPVDFVWEQLGLATSCTEANKKTLENALTDDSALDKAYSWIADHCGCFLAFSAFLRQSQRFISEFFALVQDMYTPELDTTLKKQSFNVEQVYQLVYQYAQGGDLLLLSQEMMGKDFQNRGPYSEFVFFPSYLLPMRACRFFDVDGEHKRQILFLTLRQINLDREEKVKALKALADPTRYQILMLLAKEGPMRGMDIAKIAAVAASTISHHMEQMKECGLITEEPVKNSKYYSLSKQSAKALLDEIAIDFELE